MSFRCMAHIDRNQQGRELLSGASLKERRYRPEEHQDRIYAIIVGAGNELVLQFLGTALLYLGQRTAFRCVDFPTQVYALTMTYTSNSTRRS